MKEKQNISLLRQPQNTLMYFAQLDRTGHAVSIEKVLYLGYEEDSRKVSYEETGRERYFEYDQPTFHITFKSENGKEFTIEIDNFSYWNGLRAFDTDEHFACGRAEYPFIDYYFTTSKHKLLSFLEREKYIDKLKRNKTIVDNALNFIDRLKEEE